jgi:hypothetical protein
MRFYTILPLVIGLLQGQRRVTYRTLKDAFCIDDTLLEEIREELTLRRLAVDEDAKVLVWIGEIQPAGQPALTLPNPPVTAAPTTYRFFKAHFAWRPPVTHTSLVGQKPPI